MNNLIAVSVLFGVLGVMISTIGGIAVLSYQALQRKANIKPDSVSKPKDIKMTIEIGTVRQVIEKRSTGNLKEDLEKMARDLADFVS